MPGSGYFSKIILNGTTLMDVTQDTVAADKLMTNYTATKNDGSKITGTLSGAVVVTEEQDAAGGTIKHITATNISDTTAVASDVASGKYFYTAAGVKTAGTAGSGSSYTLLGTKEVTVTTTSTSAITVDTMVVTRAANHYQKMLYIQIRDKNGPQNGYFYGTDTFWKQPQNGSQLNNYRDCCVYIKNNNAVTVSSTSQYGVFPSSPPTFSSGSVTITIKATYNSSYSLAIDGTYVVNVYDLEWPGNISPFATT